MRYTIFYGQQVFSQGEHGTLGQLLRDAPDGAIMFDADASFIPSWYDKYLNPIAIEDVPAELRMLQLLLNL